MVSLRSEPSGLIGSPAVVIPVLFTYFYTVPRIVASTATSDTN